MPYVLIVVAVLAIVGLVLALRQVRQQHVGVVERVGKFHKTIGPGLHLIVPIIDRVVYTMDTREVVLPFPPQGVITQDNLMVSIDSVIYFQIVDSVRAAYEAQNYIQAIEQLTQTTLRNIIGGLDLEQTLTSREEINAKLRTVLDEATGKWGIKVNRVELRSIEPPATIRDAMEKGARAERDKRAAILLAEGQRQSQILSASGDREASILRAQGERESAVLRAQADRQAAMLRAEGEAQAITTVFGAIHAGQPDQSLLSYQYLQMLPKLAQGSANKVWVIPSELNDALKGLGSIVGDTAARYAAADPGQFKAPEKIDVFAELERSKKEAEEVSQQAVEEAISEARTIEGRRAARLASPALDAGERAGRNTAETRALDERAAASHDVAQPATQNVPEAPTQSGGAGATSADPGAEAPVDQREG